MTDTNENPMRAGLTPAQRLQELAAAGRERRGVDTPRMAISDSVIERAARELQDLFGQACAGATPFDLAERVLRAAGPELVAQACDRRAETWKARGTSHDGVEGAIYYAKAIALQELARDARATEGRRA